MLDSDIQTISNIEPKLLGTKCPICQEDFNHGQQVAKYRCGHAVCDDCFKNIAIQGWTRCTLCRKSGIARTTRAITDPDVD
ncbi:MAG: RING finger domain-containing protein [Candidatus Fonsibacter sp.]